MTAPRHITAACFPPSASFFAATGISNDPGTRTSVMRSSPMPCRRSASSAPATSGSTTNELNRAATIANRPSGGEKSPSRMVMRSLLEIHAVEEFFVALGAGHAVGQKFHGLDGVHVGEDF